MLVWCIRDQSVGSGRVPAAVLRRVGGASCGPGTVSAPVPAPVSMRLQNDGALGQSDGIGSEAL